MRCIKKKEIKPLPFPVYFWTVAVFSLAGLVDSVYLSISHYRVYTDIGYKSFCAISRTINCDTVSQSPFSIFLNVPVPVWGIIGYTFFLLLVVFAWTREMGKKRIWTILFLLSLVFSIYSVILAVITTFYIQSYCIMCILSYGINFFLLYYLWLMRKRFACEGIIKAFKQDFDFLGIKKVVIGSVFLPFLITAGLTVLYFPNYWTFKPPAQSAAIPTGTTEDGHPWIGAESPELVITEYADYLCFQCKKMHYYLRELIAKNPDKIRLIHHHFPMDHEYNFIVKHPFHVGSGKMALLAVQAGAKGKFWQMNDVLFGAAGETHRINIKDIATRTGLDYPELLRSANDPKALHQLKVDIWQGMKLRMTGTPSFFIDGKVYQGQIPSEIFKKMFN